MTDAEDGVIWTHAKNSLKAHRKLSIEESGIAQTLVFICCERGYSMRFDVEEITAALNKSFEGSGSVITREQVETLRPKLLKYKFFEENDGVWTLHPHIYLTEDPYAEDAA